MTNKQMFESCGMTRRSLLGTAGLAAFGGGMLPRPGLGGRSAGVSRGACPLHLLRRGTAAGPLQDVRPDWGAGTAGQRQDGRDQDQPYGQPRLAPGLPSDRAHYWTHPSVIAATVHLMGRAGARRIRLLESPWKSAEPVEEFMAAAGWDPRIFTSAASNVEFENTNFLGFGKKYIRFPVPDGGTPVPGVRSQPRLCRLRRLCLDREDEGASDRRHYAVHEELLRDDPCTIYGDGAPEWTSLAWCRWAGAISDPHGHAAAVQERAAGESTRRARGRAAIVCRGASPTWWRARPVHLAIIDGIESQTGGEGIGSRTPDM